MLEDQRSGAIHDALALLKDKISFHELSISVKELSINESPFTCFQLDYERRLRGDDWADL